MIIFCRPLQRDSVVNFPTDPLNHIKSSPPGQNGHFQIHFRESTLCILNKILLKFVAKAQLKITEHWFR